MTDTESRNEIPGYELAETLRAGAVRRTVRGVRTADRQPVIITFLEIGAGMSETAVAALRTAGEALNRNPHSSVARVIESGAHEGIVFQATEDVEGKLLHQILRERRLRVPQVLQLFRMICEGLAAAHEAGVIHGSLDPTSIVVDPKLTRLKLLAFGFPQAMSTQPVGDTTLPTAKLSSVRLQYLAPELATSQSEPDERSDIYAAGAIVYEMLTGQVPVGRFSLPSQLNQEVPSDLDPIVLKCLSTDSRRRFASIAELRRELRYLESRLGVGLVGELSDISRTASRLLDKPRARIAVVAVLLLALAAAGLLLWRWSRQRPSEPPPAQQVSEGASAAPPPAAEEPEAAPPEQQPVAEVAEEPPTDPPAPRAPKPAAPAQPSPPADLAPALRSLRAKIDGGQPAEAITELNALIAGHADNPALPQAELLLALAQLGAGRQDEARTTFAAVRERHPSTAEAAEAGFRLGELDAGSTDPVRVRAARAALAEVADRYPDSAWAPRALVSKAALEDHAGMEERDAELGTVPASLATRRRFVQSYPSEASAETALWQLAEQYVKLKAWEDAAATYLQLGNTFPETRLDAWWEAAQILDDRLDNKTAALAAYEHVPASSENHDKAQRRVRRLSH